jgi:hypothetical protein
MVAALAAEEELASRAMVAFGSKSPKKGGPSPKCAVDVEIY